MSRFDSQKNGERIWIINVAYNSELGRYADANA